MKKTPEEIRDQILKEAVDERVRQIQGEGYTIEVDDLGNSGRLAAAAACYSIHSAYVLFHAGRELTGTPEWWPFAKEHWNPKSPRQNLIRALALTLAEVEKLDRARVSTEEPATPAP